jgi:hypothetical protein
MTKQSLYGGAIGLAMLLGLSACTDPYDPAQRAVGGGLLGAGYYPPSGYGGYYGGPPPGYGGYPPPPPRY